MIAEELPASSTGMVRIAAVGRSLGVHLVLATQRPAGIVSRRHRGQRQPADRLAGAGPGRLRGRHRGAGCGRASARTHAGAGLRPHRIEPVGAVPDRPGRRSSRAGPVPLPRRAADRRPIWATRRLRATVRAAVRPSGDRPAARSSRRRGEAARILGLPASAVPGCRHSRPGHAGPAGDGRPALVRAVRRGRPARAADPADARLGPRAGRPSAGGRHDAQRTHHAACAPWPARWPAQLGPGPGAPARDRRRGRALLALSRLPQVGVVAGARRGGPRRTPAGPAGRGGRRAAVAAVGRPASAHWPSSTPASRRSGRLPYLVLMLDGWESLARGLGAGRPRASDRDACSQLMRDGAAVGLRVVDHRRPRAADVPDRRRWCATRSMLRLADPADLVLAGVPAAAVPRHLPPGSRPPVGRPCRGAGRAAVGPTRRGRARSPALERIARAGRCRPSCARRRRPIADRAPARQVGYDEVSRARRRGRTSAGPWSASAATRADRLGLRLRGSSALVAGPPRSGRSTTLATMARWLAAATAGTWSLSHRGASFADGRGPSRRG